ncbi:hypothetical protein DdX_17777 [Ditylenchus destructor]|uniref:Uncharacterized protein n=1 Tax=Ditylenchus destructor TaxID=166010 RepID=A0AAD4MMT7_9BILA|nr:hypothetical protein DdX_17777 [Ditylenchus destructor]
MRIVILVLLCFLVLFEAVIGKVEIHGTVLVKLPKAHPKPSHIVVMIKPAASNAKADEHEEEVECHDDPKEDKADKAHKSYLCPYKKLSVEHHGDEKIKVGARLDSKKHLGGKLLHEINGKGGKDKAEAWSSPVAVPENHEVDFNFNLKNEHAQPTVKVKVVVHIKGRVHLKLVKGHKKPPHVTILIKTTTNPKKPTTIKSKDCENDVCPYEGNFIATKEHEKFHIIAFVDEKHHSKPSVELTVGNVYKLERDFNLHVPAGDGLPTIDWKKQGGKTKGKKGGRNGGEDGSNGGGDNKEKGKGKKGGAEDNPEAED